MADTVLTFVFIGSTGNTSNKNFANMTERPALYPNRSQENDRTSCSLPFGRNSKSAGKQVTKNKSPGKQVTKNTSLKIPHKTPHKHLIKTPHKTGHNTSRKTSH